MNIDQLQTFQAVATTGSFTKASRKVFLSQSAVSQQIQALEAFLGVKLFDRMGKKINLTREGDMLLARTSKIASELRDIKTLFEDLSNLNSGRLDIGSSAIFGTYFLPNLISKFSSEHPGIGINLHAGNSHRILSMLLDDKIEFGFGSLFEDEARINFTIIHSEPFVAVVGSQHTLADIDNVTLNELKTIPFILREEGTRIRRDVDAWLGSLSQNFRPEQIIEVGNVETAKRLIEEGCGITIVPRAAVQRELRTGHLKNIQLPKFDLTAHYYLYYPKHKSLSRAANAFVSLLAKASSLSHGDNLDLEAL